MDNEQKSSEECDPSDAPKAGWIARSINYGKRKFQERGARKEKETPQERAARRTVTATWVIAIFTASTVGVSILNYSVVEGQLAVMRGQLDAMERDQRPWVYVSNTTPKSSLIFNQRIAPEGPILPAALLLEFNLRNSGKTPARRVTIAGTFFFAKPPIESIAAGWQPCDELRATPINDLKSGQTVFPNQDAARRHLFVMDGPNLEAWQKGAIQYIDKKSPLPPGAPMIVGCVDYVWEARNRHHQTRFFFEVDKYGTNAQTLDMIDPRQGQVPPEGIVLAINPNIPADAD